MQPGPYGFIVNKSYLSDDGSQYTIGVPEGLANVGNGLTGAIPSDPAFPAIWRARYALCKRNFFEQMAPFERYVRVPCNRGSPIWNAGPGSSVLIGIHVYTVTRCVGEQRID